jgi:hypothetical protein
MDSLPYEKERGCPLEKKFVKKELLKVYDVVGFLKKN